MDQKPVRERLMNLLRVHPMTTQQLAAKMGLSEVTISRFIKDGRDTAFKTFLIIDSWVCRTERENVMDDTIKKKNK